MDLANYSLVYNAAAHFAAIEKYPDGLANAVADTGFAGFEATCWALEQLSTQGELVRRDMGHDRQEPLSMQRLLLHMKPGEAIGAKVMVMAAIAKGLKMEGQENEEVDEVLMELEKKTGSE